MIGAVSGIVLGFAARLVFTAMLTGMLTTGASIVDAARRRAFGRSIRAHCICAERQSSALRGGMNVRVQRVLMHAAIHRSLYRGGTG